MSFPSEMSSKGLAVASSMFANMILFDLLEGKTDMVYTISVEGSKIVCDSDTGQHRVFIDGKIDD